MRYVRQEEATSGVVFNVVSLYSTMRPTLSQLYVAKYNTTQGRKSVEKQHKNVSCAKQDQVELLHWLPACSSYPRVVSETLHTTQRTVLNGIQPLAQNIFRQQLHGILLRLRQGIMCNRYNSGYAYVTVYPSPPVAIYPYPPARTLSLVATQTYTPKQLFNTKYSPPLHQLAALP